MWLAVDSALPTLVPAGTEKNLLIPRWFGSPTRSGQRTCCAATGHRR